jgi:hypothetical protein
MSADRQPDEPEDPADRRTSPRVPASAVPNLKARLLAGPDVRLVDLSRRGVLLETQSRLLPGSPIRLKFVADDAVLVLKGAVVRSSVSTFGEQGLVYRTAVAFDEDITICDASLWVAPPPAPAEPPREFPRPNTGEFLLVPPSPGLRAEDVPAAATAEKLPPSPLPPSSGPSGPSPEATDAAPSGTTVITLFANDSEAFRTLLAANDW